jgi:hypothetical protein
MKSRSARPKAIDPHLLTRPTPRNLLTALDEVEPTEKWRLKMTEPVEALICIPTLHVFALHENQLKAGLSPDKQCTCGVRFHDLVSGAMYRLLPFAEDGWRTPGEIRQKE